MRLPALRHLRQLQRALRHQQPAQSHCHGCHRRFADYHHCFACIRTTFAPLLTRPCKYSLYRAPVESDIKAKLPKDPPTRARSTIRRTRHNISDSSSRPASASVQYFARRVGLGPRARARVISPPTAESPWTPWDNIEPGEADAVSQSAARRPIVSGPYSLSRDNTTQDGSVRREPILREVITRNGPMSQEVVRYFGEHMARLYAGTSSLGTTQESEATPVGEGREPTSSSLDDVPSSLERTEQFSQVSDFRPASRLA